MKHKKLIIIGGIILLMIVGVVVYQRYQAGKNPDLEVFKVVKSDIAETVSSTGTVEPASQLDLQFTTSGRIVEAPVKVGDSVKAGQVLMRIDSSDLAFQLQSAQASLQASQAKLNQLLAGASAEDIALAQTAVANAQKGVDDAKKTLADAQTSADNSLKEAYEDAQRTIESSLLVLEISLKTNSETLASDELKVDLYAADKQAVIDAKDLKYLAQSNYDAANVVVSAMKADPSEQNIDNAAARLRSALSGGVSALSRTYDVLNAMGVTSTLTQTELDTFKSDLTAARTNISTSFTNVVSSQQDISSQKISNQTNLNSARAKLSTADGALKTSQDQLTLKTAKPRQADTDLLEAQVRQAQASVSQIRNQIAQKNLIAPLDGVVTEVLLEKGETALANQTVISLNSLANFEVRSDIAESDIAKIKVGNSVKIAFDALGGEFLWQGRVVKIDPAETLSQGVVFYQTTIVLTSDEPKVKPGMTADLEIETQRHESALTLNARAISQKQGEKFVKIKAGGQLKEIKIEIGLKSDNGEVEVLSGLKEGDEVMVENEKK